MALIAICVHSTDDNGRLKYTKECLNSLAETVNLDEHPVYIINNNSSQETYEFLMEYKDKFDITLFNLKENIGTARGINMALALREPKQVCVKLDDDTFINHQDGWVEELEDALQERPDIGILGLKRDDVWQRPTHEDVAYRTHMEGKFEICPDIIGTCTAFSPALLDKIGFSMQPSPYYGGEDVLMSVRSIAAGFKNAFLPHIKITHLDDGLNPYCDWKRKEAGKYIGELSILCDKIRSGQMSYFYDGQ